MVRYDPTQEEHKKYVKDKPELPKQKRPKKQKVEQNKVVAEAVVDTDKYYKVGDKLKDVFNSQNQFSFTSLFQTSDKSKLNKKKICSFIYDKLRFNSIKLIQFKTFKHQKPIIK